MIIVLGRDDLCPCWADHITTRFVKFLQTRSVLRWRQSFSKLPAVSLLILKDEKGIHIFTPWPNPGCFALRYALTVRAMWPSRVTYINTDKELFVAEWQPAVA